MTPLDVLRFVARSLHIAAISIWLGSGLLYMLAKPMLSRSPYTEGAGSYSRIMRTLAGRSFALSLASGVYLLFDRLANPNLGLPYIVVLATKMAVVTGIAWIISMSRGSGKASVADAKGTPNASQRDQGRRVLALGTIALVLGVILTLIYEAEISKS